MLKAKAFLRGTSTGKAGGFPTQKRLSQIVVLTIWDNL